MNIKELFDKKPNGKKYFDNDFILAFTISLVELDNTRGNYRTVTISELTSFSG